MRIYAERRSNEFQEQHFPAHLTKRCADVAAGSLSTPPDHTSITYTPYR